jgi:hypothetical protein
MIVHDLAADKVLDLHIVAALRLIPSCPSHLMLCLDVFVETVLSCKVVEVGEDFSRAGIYGRPVKFGLKGPCIVV